MVSLDEIVAHFGGDLVGNGEIAITSLAPLGNAGPGQLAFLSNSKYQAQLAETRAAAVILSPTAAAACPVAAIITPQPYLYFARVARWLQPPLQAPRGIHPSAVVDSAIPGSACIGPNVRIGADVLIGENAIIEANCVIGSGVAIGADSMVYPNVTIYDGCRVGARAIIHAGAVIGSDGFGFAREVDGHWLKIPQTGSVIIGNDVEIGANTTIDRGALEDTVIDDGVKLDNQIQIAHNVRVGAHTAMAGCVGIAGSASIGARCTIGGGAIILGHLTLADEVHVSAGTLVTKSIAQAGTYTGTVPFMAHDDWLKNFARLRHLDAMADKIRALEKRLARFENLQEKD